MNWIERLFGVFPDGGNGSAEFGVAFAVAFVLVVGLAGAGFVRKRRSGRASLGRSRAS
jgi:hypothetical protein